MNSRTINSIPFFFFDILDQPGLLHFVSTRNGGISEGQHSSFNLSFRVDDNPHNVRRNRQIIADTFGIDPHNMVFSSQTHEDNVAVINRTLIKKSQDEREKLLFGIDAMVTNITNVCLCILTADCASVVLYDPVKKAVGIAHAGWKGTIKKIAAKTLDTMVKTYGTNPADTLVAIGPCICGDSFEVGEEVAEVFGNTFPDENNIVIRKTTWPRPHVDIVTANIEILKDHGIEERNIETSGLCTFQNSNTFFSARQNHAGRFASGIMLK